MGRPVEGAGTGLPVAGSGRAGGRGRPGTPGNLPAELSTFVGRADDLARRPAGQQIAARATSARHAI
jgi:hypothetical protein